MATTAFVEITAAVRGIQNRTDSAGAAVTDLSGEEDRLVHALLTEGALSDAAFLVQASSGMTVTVGSGVAKADLFAVAGEIAGQGTYIARLDAATVNVTASAADPAQARVDEVYLVVNDDPYDSSSRALARLALRTGTVGGGNPGPDTAWKASALLARLAVGAAASSISAANITDARDFAQLRSRTGTIEWTAETSAPSGTLLCDGTAVSRATYRRLFRTIGTTYGAGNGTTTFNVPNLKGRVPVGIDSSQTEFDTVGETGGAKTHTLTIDEMPSHTHNYNDPADVNVQDVAFPSGVAAYGPPDGVLATTATGGGGGHNNLQPYLVLNPIIWT